MNRLITFAACLLLHPVISKAQQPVNKEKTTFALELTQFATESGFKSGSELYFTVIPDSRKQISLGIYFCSEYKKITGISVHHERTLMRISKGQQPFITPYAFYDFIYRKNTIREVLTDKEKVGNMVTYASMEHHIGVGARIMIMSSLYLKTEAGYGVYLGSIKRPSAPDRITGEISGTNGLGMLAKIGICYTF